MLELVEPLRASGARIGACERSGQQTVFGEVPELIESFVASIGGALGGIYRGDPLWPFAQLDRMRSVMIEDHLSLVLKEQSPVLVCFYLKGYEPCARLERILKQCQEKSENVTFVYVDVDLSKNLAEEVHSLFSHPTITSNADHKEVDRFLGVDQEGIAKFLEKYEVVGFRATPGKPDSDKDPGPEGIDFCQEFIQSLWNPPVLKEFNPADLPPESVLDDAHTQLSIVFDPETQTRAARSSKDKPISEPTLTLYCPIEGGEYVVDATVQALAERFEADIQVLDLTRLVIEQWSNVWKDVIQPQDPVKDYPPPSPSSSSTPSYPYPPISCPFPGSPPVYHKVGDGYFSIYHAPDTNKLKRLAKQLVNSSSHIIEHKKRARILYMRDFGVVAKLAPELYAAVVVEIQETLVGADAKSVPVAIILGTSPFVNKSGLFQKSQDEEYTRRGYRRRYIYDSPPDDKPDDKPDTWDETDDAQEAREKRNQRQFKMWSDGSLAAHVEGQLSGAGVFSGVTTSNSIPGPGSRQKHSRVCVVIPSTRDLAKERAVRERIRLDPNNLHMRLMLFSDQMELSGSPTELQAVADEFVEHCRDNVLVAEQVNSLINQAAAGKLTNQTPNTVLTWDALAKAWQTEKRLDRERSEWIKNSNPKEHDVTHYLQKSLDPGRANSVDLVDQVKSMDLNSYEQDLLRCLIKPEQIQTTFDSVYLPAETIDIVRSLVSLPLICPDAFQTGLLKEHNMTGALFFGLPGTGKTHLARAIAKESGSRMIAVKPSDIMDKYVGESEKIIGGLFQLARRLKPCIVFIDEVDSLFAARTSGSSSCSRWRNDMLTQFAQEMDGLHVSDVVVIGTTNRPFDLDDAMVRRLPCRVLIDLPDDTAREAILKILLKNEQMEDDVDLKDLARQTMRYSGSDLKSLCVTAAYESVKELAKVPWRTSTQSDSLSNQLSLSGIPTPAPTDAGSGSPTGSFVGVSSVQNTTAEVQGESLSGFGKYRKLITESYLEHEQKSVTPKPRTLAKRHFTHALMQVRASTSESQESSIRLREWDEQFGSAKQRKFFETEPPFRDYPRQSAESESYLRQLGIS